MVEESPGRRTQARVFRDGALGRRQRVPASPDALAAAARRRMSRVAWAYVAGSAGTEATAAANRAALDRVRLVPRMLRDVSRRDLGVELLGRRRPTPLLLCPIGVLELVHPDADLAVARAARAVEVPMIVSTQASVPMERVADALGHGRTGPDHHGDMRAGSPGATRAVTSGDTQAGAPGDRPGPGHRPPGEWWFQLYWSADDDLVTSLVSRAEAAGASAVVVTVDTHMLGWRPRDLDLGFLPFARGQGIAQYTSDPVFRELVRRRLQRPAVATSPRPRPTPAALRTLVGMTRRVPGEGSLLTRLRSPYPRAAVETFLDVFSRSSLTWAELAQLRERTTLPVLVKGLQSPEDARLAVDHGVDGIVVSNHGGRQVDGAIGSLDALPGVVDAVGDLVPVLLDSGVRSGADVAKAMALGAAAVGIGRPWVYGLAVAGPAGVRAVVENLVAELDLTLGLVGRAALAELRHGGAVAHGVP